MVQFVHPARDDITLEGLLGALSDPMRLKIVKGMIGQDCGLNCTEAMPFPDMAKSTLSHHFRILREAGLVHTSKKGVENRNTVRVEDIEARFPGLLKMILGFASP